MQINLEKIKNLTLYPQNHDSIGPVISFSILNIHGYDLTKLLDTYGICIRSGHHCAQPILKKYKIDSLNRVSLYFYNTIPILGVCLGHQIIGQAFKSKIVIAKKLMHGKTSLIKHTGQGIFKGIKKVISATRYHSLIIDKKNFSSDLIITAETKDKVIMGIMHNKYNIHGVQFHPESIKTAMGLKILKNFINYKC